MKAGHLTLHDLFNAGDGMVKGCLCQRTATRGVSLEVPRAWLPPNQAPLFQQGRSTPSSWQGLRGVVFLVTTIDVDVVGAVSMDQRKSP